MQRALASNQRNHFMQSLSPSVHQRPRSLVSAERQSQGAGLGRHHAIVPTFTGMYAQGGIDLEQGARHGAPDVVAGHADRLGHRGTHAAEHTDTVTKRNISTPTRSVGSLDGMRKWQEAG